MNYFQITYFQIPSPSKLKELIYLMKEHIMLNTNFVFLEMDNILDMVMEVKHNKAKATLEDNSHTNKEEVDMDTYRDGEEEDTDINLDTSNS